MDCEAEDYLNYYVVDKGDDVAVTNLTNVMMANAQTLPQELMEEI